MPFLRALLMALALVTPAKGFLPRSSPLVRHVDARRASGATASWAVSGMRRRADAAAPFSSPLATTIMMAEGGRDGIRTEASRTMTAGGFGTGGEAPFELRGFSLGDAALAIGGLITVSSFAQYFNNVGGLSGLGFVYGLPIMLIGASLKYAELPPVPVQTTEANKALFELKATETIKQIDKDVTRHRYGDEAHLDTTVKRLGLVLPQREYPQLQYLAYDRTPAGELEFTMVWESQDTPFRIWNEEERLAKYDTFFGPGVWSEVLKVSGPDRLVGIKLTTGERPAAPAPAPATEQPAADEAPVATA